MRHREAVTLCEQRTGKEFPEPRCVSTIPKTYRQLDATPTRHGKPHLRRDNAMQLFRWPKYRRPSLSFAIIQPGYWNPLKDFISDVAGEVPRTSHAKMNSIWLDYICCGVSQTHKTSVLITKDVTRGDEPGAEIFRDRFDRFIVFKTIGLKD